MIEFFLFITILHCFLVKVNPEGKYMVDIDKDIDIAKVSLCAVGIGGGCDCKSSCCPQHVWLSEMIRTPCTASCRRRCVLCFLPLYVYCGKVRVVGWSGGSAGKLDEGGEGEA